jgi:cell division protein FtsB
VSSRYYIDDGGNADVSIWQRISRLLSVLLLLTVVAIIIGAFMPELNKQRTERVERARLYKEIEEQKRVHARFGRQVSLLMNDPVYLESIARDRFEMMKDGETVFRLEEKARPSPPPEPIAPLPRKR